MTLAKLHLDHDLAIFDGLLAIYFLDDICRAFLTLSISKASYKNFSLFNHSERRLNIRDAFFFIELGLHKAKDMP